MQSNFNQRDKILLKIVRFCADSPAADTFTSEQTLALHLLSGAPVVTKFPVAGQRGQPKDDRSFPGLCCIIPLCPHFGSGF